MPNQIFPSDVFSEQIIYWLSSPGFFLLAASKTSMSLPSNRFIHLGFQSKDYSCHLE
ncbi:MAG: hypothetical protein P8I93_05150 [Crocinitomicaceae bacterium]|nr:hypothetical protein [Crocinitomicaceae bacterium]